jgi:dephospho-CoA kinase
VTGLVGGIASGKSLVAGELQRLGAARIDADALSHEVLREREVEGAVIERFGAEVRAPDGTVDRRALAGLVFGDSEALHDLEALLHPRIRARIAEALAGLPPGRVVVLEAALLLENGLDRICDLVVAVEVPESLRTERAVRDRGWSAGEVGRREGHQLSAEEKTARADVVIPNTGTREDLRRRVGELWVRLATLAEGRRAGPRRKR